MDTCTKVREELKEMQKIADSEGAKYNIEPADWWYFAEKLRKEKYNLDDTEIRPFFKLENAREAGLSVRSLPGSAFTFWREPRLVGDLAAFDLCRSIILFVGAPRPVCFYVSRNTVADRNWLSDVQADLVVFHLICFGFNQWEELVSWRDAVGLGD